MKKIIQFSILKFFLSVLILSAWLSSNIIPQDTTVTNNKDPEGGWLAVPFAGYTPETEWSFGAAGLFYFYVQPPVSEKARLSNFLAAVQYTTKEQMLIELNYDLYFKNDNYRLFGILGYAKFPFSFYGIGNNTKEDDEESYTTRYFKSEITFIRNLIRKGGSGLNAGIKYDLRNDKIIELEQEKLLHNTNITGKRGGMISGLGFIVSWDTRDNTFSTSYGEYVEATANIYGSYFLSDYNFNKFIIDLRKYLNFPVLDTTHVLAAQLLTEISTGDVPFYKLSTFGGDREMRGIFLGKYRDKNAFLMQAEYRFHVIWRIGLVAFAGIGEVASKISAFALSELRATYGFGFRFSVIPEEKIMARIDFGFSKGVSQFYLGFSEAF